MRKKHSRKRGSSTEKIGPKDMVKDILDRYDVLFLPGAFPLRTHNKGGFLSFLSFLRRLALNYRGTLLDYIKGGGGLVAVCASVAVMGNRMAIPLPIKPYFHRISTTGCI